MNFSIRNISTEDYNTGSLPHERFYNVEAWEAKQRSKVAPSANLPPAMPSLLDDEEALRLKGIAQRNRLNPMFSRDQIAEIARVERERVEADRMRKLGFTPKDDLGVRFM
jgi:hypothetical protein